MRISVFRNRRNCTARRTSNYLIPSSRAGSPKSFAADRLPTLGVFIREIANHPVILLLSPGVRNNARASAGCTPQETELGSRRRMRVPFARRHRRVCHGAVSRAVELHFIDGARGLLSFAVSHPSALMPFTIRRAHNTAVPSFASVNPTPAIFRPNTFAEILDNIITAARLTARRAQDCPVFTTRRQHRYANVPSRDKNTLLIAFWTRTIRNRSIYINKFHNITVKS